MSICPKCLRCSVENAIIKRKSFITGGANAEIALLNPEGNPCYFTFELVLTDTDEVLYTSKQVEPGQMIANITLNRALPAGQYNAELRITTASLQDGNAMNGANVVTVLDVQ